jgi:hypothetical protein
MAESALRALMQGGPAPAGMASIQTVIQNAAQRPQSRADLLGGLSQFTSLDTPQDMSLGATAADIALGFAPGIGTAQGIRDFERARRDDDMLGMALGGLSAIPVAGGIIKAGRGIGKAANVAQEIRESASPSALRDVDVSYRGEHTTPGPDYGAPLHDLTQMMPSDVYDPIGKRLYGMGDPRIDSEVFSALRAVRNSPNAFVRAYRAVPSNVDAINPGDWVTTSKTYAKMHGENALGGNYKIIEQKVVKQMH